MNSTNLTIIISAADQAAAQADTSVDYFIHGASPTGAEPATHYFSSGFFSNDEVDKINNVVAWDSMIRCPEWQMALAAEGLQAVVVEQPVANQGLVTEDLQTVTPPISQQT